MDTNVGKEERGGIGRLELIYIHYSWETYMQVRKQQLELDMEQQTGSK